MTIRLQPTRKCSKKTILTVSKRSIQKKLENWQKSIPSNALLQFKIDTANLRRQTALMNTIMKATKHTNGVKEKVREVHIDEVNKSQILRDGILNKEIVSSAKKQTLMQSISDRIKEENLRSLAAQKAQLLRSG